MKGKNIESPFWDTNWTQNRNSLDINWERFGHKSDTNWEQFRHKSDTVWTQIGHKFQKFFQYLNIFYKIIKIFIFLIQPSYLIIILSLQLST
jgi:hypothetical protein